LLPDPRALRPVTNFPAMKYDDVPDLYQKLIASDSIPELALAFAVLTATRSQEARGAKWSEIDLKTAVWTIPPERMKTRKEHRVPLSDEALRIIERLPRNGEFLFSVDGVAPIVSVSLMRVLKRHAGDGLTVHGFRSCFRDWGSEKTSAPRELLEIALAHTIGGSVERAYSRSDLLEKRRGLMQSWAAFCSTPDADRAANVVPMKR
jgi:integrase